MVRAPVIAGMVVLGIGMLSAVRVARGALVIAVAVLVTGLSVRIAVRVWVTLLSVRNARPWSTPSKLLRSWLRRPMVRR